MNSFAGKYLGQLRLVVLLILTIVAIGVTSLLLLQRRLNPQIKLTIVSVVTVLPGANPQDVESLLTNPLEDKLTGIKGLDTINSTSQENVSVISIQFLSTVDKDKARNDVQTAVNEVIPTLPADSQTPKVTALDFEDEPIWTFSLSTGADTASLMRFADHLKEQIKHLSVVDRVVLDGFDSQQIQIILEPEKIKNFGLNPLTVANSLKTAIKAYPAGNVNSANSSFSLALAAEVKSVEDIRNLHLIISGQTLHLGEIAKVFERSAPNQKTNFIATPEFESRASVTFSVYKTTSADIVKSTKAVEKLVDEVVKTDNRFQIFTLVNAGEEIDKQFTDLVGEFRSTIILVFINLFLFLGIKQAAIACLTIPLTFLMSFAWMNLLGQSINFVSLFALLLAFGTSIDDTIVTVSAMTAYYKTKKLTPMETGLLVWKDFVVPIWTTTATTVWAFLPLILSTGIIGEFIKPIPIVVATTMYTSTAVTWFITLPLMIFLLKPKVPNRVTKLLQLILVVIILVILFNFLPKNWLLIPILIVTLILILVGLKSWRQLQIVINRIVGHLPFHLFSQGIIKTHYFERKYERMIGQILASKFGRRATLGCLVVFAFCAYLLVPTGIVKNEFFPKTNAETIYLNLDFPAGTNLETITSQSLQFSKNLRQIPEVRAVVVQIGTQAGSSYGQSSNLSSAGLTLILTTKESRKITSSEIAQNLRQQFGNFAPAKVSITEISGGPPAGADIQIKLQGDDLNQLNSLANKVVDYLRTVPGVINTEKSLKSGTSKINFTPDRAKLAAAGLTQDVVGFWLRLAASGLTLNKVKFDNRDQDVALYTSQKTLSPENISQIFIPTTTGYQPLISLGDLKLENNPTTISHEAGQRQVSVSAGVLPGFSVSETNKKLEQFATTFLNLPSGYSWKTGGVNEENQKSVNSIFRAMSLSFILIMATMVIEFRSYRQAAMILGLIPLAISGVFIIFGLTGTPLSFPALIGVMALFGVVVTNAMFIVEKINQNVEAGMELKAAIADAGRSRLEPILLTSLTSILGLVPITLANPMWRGLGGAIISGLMFSGLIMLLYVPVMYYTMYQGERKKISNF